MPIEQHAPGLERIVHLDQTLEELANGFGGDSGPAEGPVWWHEGGYLLFSDIGQNRRMKWAPGEGSACTMSQRMKRTASPETVRAGSSLVSTLHGA
jgi:hypothetical protein